MRELTPVERLERSIKRLAIKERLAAQNVNNAYMRWFKTDKTEDFERYQKMSKKQQRFSYWITTLKCYLKARKQKCR